MKCTFFGHADAPWGIGKELEKVLVELIEKNGVDMFYVGNNGNFDCVVRHTLNKLCKRYAQIDYEVVLAYRPVKNQLSFQERSVYPEEVARSPQRYAICKRNMWMIENSDFVVAYVYRTGGAQKFIEVAERKRKTVINLARF